MLNCVGLLKLWKIILGHLRKSNDPMKDVKEEAGLLARDDAELDTFVADLFERGDKLNIPCDEAPSDDSRKLIPTIVEVSQESEEDIALYPHQASGGPGRFLPQVPAPPPALSYSA